MKMNQREKAHLMDLLETNSHLLELVAHLMGHPDLDQLVLMDHPDLEVQEDLEDHKMDHHLVVLLASEVQDLMVPLEAEGVGVEEVGEVEVDLRVHSEVGLKWVLEAEVVQEEVEEGLEDRQAIGMRAQERGRHLGDLLDLEPVKVVLTTSMMVSEGEVEDVEEGEEEDGKNVEEEEEALVDLGSGIKKLAEEAEEEGC